MARRVAAAAERPVGPMLGRAAELGHIKALALSAAQGEGRMVLLEGEPGIGKTRLVEEVVGAGLELGMRTFCGRADELDTRRPFGVIAACLGVSAGGTGTGDPLREAIGRLVFGDLAGPGRTFPEPSDSSELRIVETIIAKIEELCAAGPLVLALDDLHWADPASLHVLHRLGRSIGELPLLVCGGMRPLPRPPELAKLLRSLSPPELEVIAVPPLASDDVAALVASVVGQRPGRRLLRLVDGAAGNPLYVTELATAWKLSGSPQGSGDVADPDAMALPPALKATVLLQVSFLSEGARELLQMASVLGSTLSVDDLAAVLGQTVVTLAPALRESMQAGLLRDDGARVAFRHDVLREALYDDVPVSLRRSLHLHVARTMAAGGAHPTDVAEHLVRGASRGDAMAREWLHRAAEEAIGRAPATAADLLQRAVELFEPDDPDRDAIAAERVQCLQAIGRVDEAEAACRELLSRRQAPRREARLRFALAQMLCRRRRYEEGLDQVARAENIQGLTPAQRLRSISVLSTVPLIASRLDLAEAMATRGLHMADTRRCDGHPDEVAEANCCFTLASVALRRARCSEALAWIKRATVSGDRVPTDRIAHGWQHLNAHSHLVAGIALMRVDRLDEAYSALAASRRTAHAAGFATAEGNAQAYLVAHHFVSGAWDDALTEFDALLDLSSELDVQPPALPLAAGARALVRLHRDGFVSPAPERVAGEADDSHLLVSPFAALADAIMQQASVSPAAIERLLVAWDAARSAGVVVGLTDLAPTLVRMTLAAGDRNGAGDVCAQVEAVEAVNPEVTTITGTVLHCRGLLDSDPGLLVEAAAALRNGPRPLEQASACEDAAAALGHSGDRHRAQPLAAEALEAYQRLQASWDLSRLRTRMQAAGVAWGGRRAHTRPRTGWLALTPSERSVVELVAEGLSNPEVAERLFVSRHTVKRHLANATAKLGLRSRVELAREVSQARA